MHVWGGDTFGCVGQDTHVEVCESLLEIRRSGLESGLLVRTLVILEPTILKRVGESYLYKRETAQFETREMETVLLSLSI